MGRKAKLRVSLDSDILFLLRLKTALEEDAGYPREWRDDVISKIYELIRQFTNAPQRLDVNKEA